LRGYAESIIKGELNMDKKTAGIIGLVAAIFFCGLPGLCGLCMGPLSIFSGIIPGSDIDILGSSDPSAAIGFGIAMLCVGIFFAAIPVLVWFFALRNKPSAEEVVEYDEPMPENDF
jgi:hypothetical protein